MPCVNRPPMQRILRHFFKELSIRIEFIVDALSERSSSVKQTVEKVKAKVFEYGELTKFWEVRLGRYEKWGSYFECCCSVDR